MILHMIVTSPSTDQGAWIKALCWFVQFLLYNHLRLIHYKSCCRMILKLSSTCHNRAFIGQFKDTQDNW